MADFLSSGLTAAAVPGVDVRSWTHLKKNKMGHTISGVSHAFLDLLVGGLGAVGSLEIVNGRGREVDSQLTISSLAFVEKSLRPVSDIVIKVCFRLKRWI